MQNAALLNDEEYMKILHIGEVAFSYYKIQRSAPSKQDYTEWLALLPTLVRSRYEALGFESGKDTMDFRSYFIDLRNREMKAYMERNLSAEDFCFWLEKRDTPSFAG